ncbi:MAG: HD domain-containing protein [Bacteriovoracia bacterium]
MEIRDVIHGTIEILKHEIAIIDSPYFQRLRNIKQMGFSENSYPNATHNRYIHSLGACHLATRAFNQIFSKKQPSKSKADGSNQMRLELPYHLIPQLSNDAKKRFLHTLRAAAMLHDIGHGPLSHTTEFAMPDFEKLNLSVLKAERRQANHEDYTLKIILDSSLSQTLEKAGLSPHHIACILNPSIPAKDDFFIDQEIDFRPVLHQIISSELDVDRMDYLTRDSFFCGVNYGKFDIDWLLQHLCANIVSKKCYLAFSHKAIYTFDDFLISRYHMFLMVYFHHKGVVYDEMLERYFNSSDCDYEIPTDIEKYVYYDDYHLYTHLSKSKNQWAKRIFHKSPYKLLVEFHSGIQDVEKKQLDKILQKLKDNRTEHILKTTSKEFSKYFGKSAFLPIYVHYTDQLNPPQFIPVEKCTDLFERYSKARSITRIYVPS